MTALHLFSGLALYNLSRYTGLDPKISHISVVYFLLGEDGGTGEVVRCLVVGGLHFGELLGWGGIVFILVGGLFGHL